MSGLGQVTSHPDPAARPPERDRAGRFPNVAGATQHGAAPIVAAAVLAFALVNLAWGELAVGEVYDEPLVGGITWDDLDKGRDFRALGLFLGATAAASLAIGSLFRRISGSGPADEVGRALNAMLWIALAPSAWWLGCRIAYPGVYIPPFEPAGAVLLVLAGAVGLRRFRRELAASDVYDIGGGIALAVAIGAMGGCALAQAIGRVSVAACDTLAGRSWAFLATGAAVAAVAVALAGATARDAASMRRRVSRVLLALQIPLPLLFSTVLVPRIVVGAEVIPPPYSASLPVGVVLVGAASWAALAHRWRSWERAGAPGGLGRVLSALCLSAIAVFYQVPPAGPPQLIGDHFHVGEQLLPWQQWSEFGLVPFVDFMPIHGLMPLLRGAINEACFQGTAATFFMTEPILYGISVVATFLAVAALVGTPTALLVALLVGLSPGYGDRLYFMAPALLAAVHPRLRARPDRWLVAWPALGVAMVFYNPSVGAAFVMATAPLGAWMAWRLLREAPRVAGRLGLIGAATAAAACLLTPAPRVARGFLQFLAENARHNQLLHGTPMELSFGPIPDRLGIASNPAVFQLMRYAWMAVALAAAGVAWSELARPRGRRRPEVLWTSALTAAMLLWNAPWAMGRIDTSTLTRTGMQSVCALVILLPVVVKLGRSATAALPLLAALPLVVGMWSPPEATSILKHLIDRPLYAHRLPEGTALVDGEELGLPNLGRVLSDPHLVIPQAVELKEVLAPLLGPGETFLDLTNQSSYYHYLGLPVPALYSANFIAGSAEMQGRMLERLREHPTPVVLIAPAINHDSGPASMRSYHLYREYASRYVAIRRGRFTLLVDPKLAPEAGPPGSDEQLALLDEVFAPPDLRRIPEAWGRSVRALAPQFRVVAALPPERLAGVAGAERLPGGDFAPSGPESELVYRLGDLGLDGRDADFLLLDFDYVRAPGAPDARIAVSWDGPDGRRSGTLALDGARSHLLVPLGSHPRWLLARGLEALRVRVRAGEGFRRFSVTNLRLLRLRPALEAPADRADTLAAASPDPDDGGASGSRTR